MQLSKEYLEQFLNQTIGISYVEAGQFYYLKGKLLEVFGDSISVFTMDKRVILLSLDCIKKIKSFSSGGVSYDQ